MDIFSEVIANSSFGRIAGNTRSLRKPSLDDETARHIVRQLAEAENPVIYAGGGVLLATASNELRDLLIICRYLLHTA
ncbi:hypothetical protein A9Q96_14605 [Rhodobacterales bacterium 52_120_T64]|nr:hypothetical protein A9Q96_14605 [Rhodobacterales bacterium 52_120_T64]